MKQAQTIPMIDQEDLLLGHVARFMDLGYTGEAVAPSGRWQSAGRPGNSLVWNHQHINTRMVGSMDFTETTSVLRTNLAFWLE